MGGITSGIGLASGIDSGTLIERLLSLEARPRTLAQQRLIQLQSQQAAYFDLNSRMNALKTAAAKFRTGKVFDSMKSTSSDPLVMTATSSTNAQTGNYTFLVDRLVTSQQLLSRGFADKDSAALGASSFTFESAVARLDRDTNLADLNGGEGIERGKISISVNSGTAVSVDLSKAATINEVIEAINGSGTGVTATAEGTRLVLRAASGTDTVTVANTAGSSTATSLGIAGTATGTLTGSSVYSVSGDTALRSLNDANGVDIGNDPTSTPSDFIMELRDGSAVLKTVDIYLGPVYETDPEDPTKRVQVEGAVSTLGQAVERINEQLAEQLATVDTTGVSVRINAAGNGLEVVNENDHVSTNPVSVFVRNRTTGSGASLRYTRTTASDLGLAGATGETEYTEGSTTSGKRLLASLNSTLTRNLNGGSGVATNGGGLGELVITDRGGAAATITWAADSSVEEIIRAINDHSSTTLTAALNAEGTGITITDSTGTPTGNLIIAGASAASLGVRTDVAGVAASSVGSDSLQHAYVTKATLVSDLNGGKGIGTGKFRVTGPAGASAVIDIGTDTKTVADLLQELNGAISSVGLTAEINAKGDGIMIRKTGAAAPADQTIKIQDTSGGVAKALRIVGEAEDAQTANFIDGSYETTVELAATDTLTQVITKINSAGAGVAASILSSGASSKPYRISLSSRESGTAGRFILDTNGFDLGLDTLEAGNDARVFLGSADPSKAILLQSSTNTMDQVITGVSIDLNATSEDPVQLTVARDTAAFEAGVNEFITAFNAVIQRIDDQSKYDEASKRKGVFLGDGTVQGIRQNLFSSIQDDGTGLTGEYKFLTQVGIGFKDGKLTFDRDRFRAALEEDFDAVKDIFAAREQEVGSEFQQIAGLPPGAKVKVPQDQRGFTKLGVVGSLEETLKDYIDTIDGSLTKRAESLGDQILLQQERITLLTAKLNSRRGILQQQFVAMERAISSLQSQSSVLGQIQSLG